MFFGKPQAEATPADIPVPQSAALPIFDVTEIEFEEKVLKASFEKPIIAYFTAPWCGPCKQLGPAIEAAVLATKGEILLAKINVDNNQGLAQALRIQSVPTVYAFFGGRPVDAFQGAVPESQIKTFIAKLVQIMRQAQPDAIDIPQALKTAAQALADKDLGQAQAIYAQILAQDEKNAAAYAGIVRVLIAAGQLDQAAQLVDNVPPDIAKVSAFQEAKTALAIAQTKPQGPTNELQAKVDKNPDDHQARYDLALAQFTSGEQEAGIDSLLEIVQRNRGWNEDEARKQLIKFFDALGHADPLVLASRKKLSSILFS